jgi:hypothetical protein
MKDLLFQPQSNQKFTSSSLFAASAFSQLDKPECLGWTPSQLFDKIKNIAQKRYGYTLLPGHMYELKGNETQ